VENVVFFGYFNVNVTVICLGQGHYSRLKIKGMYTIESQKEGDYSCFMGSHQKSIKTNNVL
jgi:thiamine pyrophosphokinase